MALYNTGYPATYQPYYQTQSTALIWVQGEAGAKSYLVAPNSTVTLWDTERQTVYIKSADASGMPSMRVLDYTIRETAQNGPAGAFAGQADKSPTYATKAEIDGILTQLRALREDVDKMKEEAHEPAV